MIALVVWDIFFFSYDRYNSLFRHCYVNKLSVLSVILSISYYAATVFQYSHKLGYSDNLK